jgi:hypothetical protein
MPASGPSVKAVFDCALEIDSPSEREAYLDAACVGAPDVRQKVEALLRAYVDAGSFLELPSPSPTDTTGTFAPDAGSTEPTGA